MEIIDQTKPVEAVVKFSRPLFYYEITNLIDDALDECNEILIEKWENMPFFKRIFTTAELYHLYYDDYMYFSHDGKAPMRRGKYPLDPEEFPDAKYEMRYLISIVGVKNIHLYFNVIPGIAQEHQFGTMIPEDELVECITIKANLKSKPYWKRRQAKFLEILVPIIERIDQETKWGHRIGDLFF